jgi:hypothetical protein
MSFQTAFCRNRNDKSRFPLSGENREFQEILLESRRCLTPPLSLPSPYNRKTIRW